MISVVDIHPWARLRAQARTALQQRFRHYSAIKYQSTKHLRYLADNYFQDTRPQASMIPPGLFKRIGAQRTIVYLATDPDHYLALLNKYWPLGDIFAIEKPLARQSPDDARKPSDKAKQMADFAQRYSGIFDKAFVPVDHYLGKYMLTVLEYIRTMPEFAEVITQTDRF